MENIVTQPVSLSPSPSALSLSPSFLSYSISPLWLQVQAQLLQFAAKNIGLNPALLTSPINPQQMTLLYQLQQLQMVSPGHWSESYEECAVQLSPLTTLSVSLNSLSPSPFFLLSFALSAGVPAFTDPAADDAGTAKHVRSHQTTRAASKSPRTHTHTRTRAEHTDTHTEQYVYSGESFYTELVIPRMTLRLMIRLFS